MVSVFSEECERLSKQGCPIHVSLDADVVEASEMPGVRDECPDCHEWEVNFR